MFYAFLKKIEFISHFQKGEISAPISPEKWIGIKPKSSENWKHFGWNIALVITIVTAITVFFQVVKQGEPNWTNWWKYLPFILVFAFVNSFVEEIITRFGVVVSLKGTVSDKVIPFISAIIFGGIHF